MTLAANFPVPIIGCGRFLDLTLRRNGDMLDLGVMSDASRLPDVQAIADRFVAGRGLYERLVPA